MANKTKLADSLPPGVKPPKDSEQQATAPLAADAAEPAEEEAAEPEAAEASDDEDDEDESPAALAKRGDEGPLVKAVQVRLNKRYPTFAHLVPNGRYTIDTEKAVRRFQFKTGLPETGELREADLLALDLGDLLEPGEPGAPLNADKTPEPEGVGSTVDEATAQAALAPPEEPADA